MFCVYAHRDPYSNLIRYIGSGSERRARLMANRSMQHTFWIKSVKATGAKPIVDILNKFEHRCDAYRAEFAMIKSLKLEGYDLLNKQMEPGWPRTGHTEEYKQKMRERFKGIAPSTEALQKAAEWHRNNPSAMLGKNHSDVTKQKLSLAMTGRISTQRIIIKCSNGMIYQSVTDAANTLNLSPSHIVKVLKGKRNHTGGLVFEYMPVAP